MTAMDMIREGFGTWADGALGPNIYTTLTVSTLLFLFGFLVTAVLNIVRTPRSVVVETPAAEPSEGLELDKVNTTRLFELESEVAASKDTLNRLTEALSTTFAHLSGGLAIFDADKSLYLFNPALSDLLDLDPAWLAKRPSIADFISMLREKRHLPEKRNFLEWRRLLTDLKDTGQQKIYDDEWVLPDGRIFRVTGQPHPKGAVAFLFEDISAQIAIERQHRSEVSLNQSILNGLSDAVAVVSISGEVTFTNVALDDLFGVELREILDTGGVPDRPECKLVVTDTTGFWPKLKAYVSAPNHPAPWEQLLTAKDNTKILAVISTLPDRSTLVVFKATPKIDGGVLPSVDALPDPLHFANLENMLRQREISLDHTGFDSNRVNQEDMVKTRRILWYLTISAANSCRKGGKITLISVTEGKYTNLSCQVSDVDQVDRERKNVAGTLLESLIVQPDGRNSWTYDAEGDPFTVSFKAQKPLKLSAV